MTRAYAHYKIKYGNKIKKRLLIHFGFSFQLHDLYASLKVVLLGKRLWVFTTLSRYGEGEFVVNSNGFYMPHNKQKELIFDSTGTYTRKQTNLIENAYPWIVSNRINRHTTTCNKKGQTSATWKRRQKRKVMTNASRPKVNNYIEAILLTQPNNELSISQNKACIWQSLNLKFDLSN